jgi:hypothetical protein
MSCIVVLQFDFYGHCGRFFVFIDIYIFRRPCVYRGLLMISESQGLWAPRTWLLLPSCGSPDGSPCVLGYNFLCTWCKGRTLLPRDIRRKDDDIQRRIQRFL